jgi:hypothetical protein
MTTENQNKGTKKRQTLLCNGIVNTFLGSEETRNNRGTLEVLFSMQSKPRLCSEDHPEPSDSKVRSRVPWDSEPRIIVLVRNRRNLAVSRESHESHYLTPQPSNNQ